MPLVKLLQLKRLTQLRRSQLRDDLRIVHAWFHTLKHGGNIFSKALGRDLTLKDVVLRHALIAVKLRKLGYIYPNPKVKHNKLYKELIRLSKPIESTIEKKSKSVGILGRKIYGKQMD